MSRYIAALNPVYDLTLFDYLFAVNNDFHLLFDEREVRCWR